MNPKGSFAASKDKNIKLSLGTIKRHGRLDFVIIKYGTLYEKYYIVIDALDQIICGRSSIGGEKIFIFDL